MSIFGGADRFEGMRVSSTPGPIYNLPTTMNISPRYDLKRRKNVPLNTTLRVPKPPPQPQPYMFTAQAAEAAAAGKFYPPPPPAPEGAAGSGGATEISASEAVARSAAAFVDPEQVIRDAIAKSEADGAAGAAANATPAKPTARYHPSPPASARPNTAARTAQAIQAWLHEQKVSDSQRPRTSGGVANGQTPPPPGVVRLRDVDRGDWLSTNPNRMALDVSPARYEPMYYADSRHPRPPTATLTMSGRNVVWRKLNDDSPGPKYDVSNVEDVTSKYKSSPASRRAFMGGNSGGGGFTDRLSLLLRGSLRNGVVLLGGDVSGLGPGSYDVFDKAPPHLRRGPAATMSGRHDSAPVYISEKHALSERSGMHSPGAIYDVKFAGDISSRAAPLEQIVRPKYKLPDAEAIREHDRALAHHLQQLQTSLRTHHEASANAAAASAAVAAAAAKAQAEQNAAAANKKPYEYDPRTIPGLLNEDDPRAKYSAEELAERAAAAEAEEQSKKEERERDQNRKLATQTPRRASSAHMIRRRVNQWKQDSHGMPASRDSWLHGVISKRAATPGSSVMIERASTLQRYAPGPAAYYNASSYSTFSTRTFNASARKALARKAKRAAHRGKPSLFAPSTGVSGSDAMSGLLTAREVAMAVANQSQPNPNAVASFPTYSQYAALRMHQQIAKQKAAEAESEAKQAKQHAAAAQQHQKQKKSQPPRSQSSAAGDSDEVKTSAAGGEDGSGSGSGSGGAERIVPHKPRTPAPRAFSKSPTHDIGVSDSSNAAATTTTATPSKSITSPRINTSGAYVRIASAPAARNASKLVMSPRSRPVHFAPRIYD